VKNKSKMKKTNILFILLLLMSNISCIHNSDQAGEVETPPNELKLASNFRSETNIIVPDGQEVFFGSINNDLLIDEIFKAVYEGKVQAYDYLDNPMTIEEIQWIESHVDTVVVENFETGILDTMIVEEALNKADVVKVFISEDWFFDKESFKLTKDVHNLTLTTLKFDLEGNEIGYEVLFKVYFNGKKPLL